MANATSITVNTLVRDTTATIVPDVLDTATNPVTISAAACQPSERVILEITNQASVALGVSLAGSTDWPSGLGTFAALAQTQVAAGSVLALGPFNHMRYLSRGALAVTFTPITTANISASITCYKLPK